MEITSWSPVTTNWRRHRVVVAASTKKGRRTDDGTGSAAWRHGERVSAATHTSHAGAAATAEKRPTASINGGLEGPRTAAEERRGRPAGAMKNKSKLTRRRRRARRVVCDRRRRPGRPEPAVVGERRRRHRLRVRRGTRGECPCVRVCWFSPASVRACVYWVRWFGPSCLQVCTYVCTINQLNPAQSTNH